MVSESFYHLIIMLGFLVSTQPYEIVVHSTLNATSICVSHAGDSLPSTFATCELLWSRNESAVLEKISRLQSLCVLSD